MEETPDFKKFIQEGYGDQQFEGDIEDVVDLPLVPESPRVHPNDVIRAALATEEDFQRKLASEKKINQQQNPATEEDNQ